MRTTVGKWGNSAAVRIPAAVMDPSVVLADQVKSLDWRKRRATRKGTISDSELAEVRGKLRALIG